MSPDQLPTEPAARQSGSQQRPRPPTMSVFEESSVPLRSELLGRRESRLGLRSLFGRKSSPKEADTMPSEKPATRASPRSAGFRQSLADMSNWSYGQHPVRPDVRSPNTYISRPLSTTVEHPSVEEMKARALVTPRNAPKVPSKPQHRSGGIVPWDAPPLFKAYPQAIKHATLPTPVLSPDAIIRLKEKRSHDLNGEGPASPGSDGVDEHGAEKRKRRRARSGAGTEMLTEWTTKIYILVTSGCLLQYASEGPFDRLPERVLQLGKSSAAFVSDVIPGRHWVVQVSSSLDADGSTTSDPRSLFSRLQFRAAERRQISNSLMVFDSADDMEGWLAILRREIQTLGGKKMLSETGNLKADEPLATLREQNSQRTLVVRDPQRYSKALSIDTQWQTAGDSNYDLNPDTELIRDQSIDGTSTTNSIMSQDGRRLENLRDSSLRSSAISTGQRTMVTTDSSSRSSSPTRDSLPPPSEDERAMGESLSSTDLRLRPNASAIASRRRSQLTSAPFVDARVLQGSSRPSSTVMSPPIPETGTAPSPGAPNFSVPHSSSRRFSYMKSNSEAPMPLSPPPRMAARKILEPIKVGRPLSMVIDQPSPQKDVAERPATRHGDGRTVPDFGMEARSPALKRASLTLPDVPRELATRRSSVLPRAANNLADANPQPRRLSSMSTLRSQDSFTGRPRGDSFGKRLSGIEPWAAALPSSPHDESDDGKRTSMFTHLPERSGRRDRRSEVHLPFVAEMLPEPSPPPNMPLPPLPPPNAGHNGHKKRFSSRNSSVALSRRSLPQLVEGPPPAPPPTCALPPVPQHPALRV